MIKMSKLRLTIFYESKTAKIFQSWEPIPKFLKILGLSYFCNFFLKLWIYNAKLNLKHMDVMRVASPWFSCQVLFVFSSDTFFRGRKLFISCMFVQCGFWSSSLYQHMLQNLLRNLVRSNGFYTIRIMQICICICSFYFFPVYIYFSIRFLYCFSLKWTLKN